MSTATETKKADAKKSDEVQINETTRALADLIKKDLKVNKDGTVELPGDIYESLLPEDLTLAVVRKVQKHRGEVVAALGVALGEQALPVFVKNKDLDVVTAGFKIAHDKLEIGVNRQRQFSDGNGGKIEKFGHVDVKYIASGATNAGEFKKMRKVIGAAYTAQFT